nr:putative ribonuclease H-like domain-containing protein [Tanacetum cinerariifolium]
MYMTSCPIKGVLRIEQYLQHEHYALWEVIEFGDSYVALKNDAATGSTSEETATKKGRTVAVTTEDMQKRRNDVKARTTLLLALSDEHQLRFSKYKTAQELWAAILKTFGGNDATKKTKKNLLKQQYGNFKAEEWLMHTIMWRNRSDLDTMSLDDLYNHLKVYEPEVQKKSESNSQNIAFISSAKNSSGNGEVNTASIPTASTQVSHAGPNVATTSISLDTACAYIASQSNGSQNKYEDINQIDEDDIKEMDIKWNMALLSMRADRYWKKTGKKISIQGTDVAGFDKSKVECFNCHKMGHFARECRAPRSQERGRKENYRQGSKEEEQAPKALMAIDRAGWDWSFIKNKEENHALVADEEAPIEFALMVKSNSDNEVFDNSLCSKAYSKLTGFQSASKDLDNLLGSQRNDKNKEGLGYSAVPPPPAQVYSPPRKDMYWTRLPEFANDTITEYSRPSPAIESNLDDLQNRNPSITKTGASSSTILSKLVIKFVKPTDSPTVVKTNKDETVRKTSVKYAEMYRKTSKRSNVRAKNNYTHKSRSPITVVHKTGRTPMRTTRPNMNAAQPKRTAFYKPTHLCINRPFQRKSAVKTQVRVPRVPTVNRKFLTANRKFPTGNSKFSTADLGNKGKAVKASACWIWRPTQNTTNKGPNSNSVSVIFKKYQYIDTQGRLKSNKKDEREIVIKNKARLVAQGYTHKEGIDYDDVFAPVARIEAIRLFLAYASFMGFTIYQIDVKSAFLYGTIDEEVYVMQPFGFQDPEFPARVYKVEKAMYGLHQAPRAWHEVTPKECHVHAVKKIFRYLKGHPKLGLWYPKDSPFDLVSYSYSDYGGATQDRKSTTGGCQFLGRRLISWQCKRQTIVATSTIKAEYVAAASGYGQVLWIQNQLLDYGYNFMNTKIYIDNNSAICIVKNPVYHSKTKHVEIGHHFIRDCFEKKLISMDHIHTHDNVADLLTKPFDARRFQYLVVEQDMRGSVKGNHIIYTTFIVDFVEASHLRYALTINPTVYVSHIQQFWSTARIKTTDEGTKILPTVDGQFSHQWKYLIHTIMQCLSPKSTGFNEFSSNIATTLVCLATNREYNFSKMIFDGIVRNVNNKVSKFLIYPRVNSASFSGRTVPLFPTMLVTIGEGSGTPTEPHHTPSLEAQQTSPTATSSPSLPPVTTATIPTVIPTDTPQLRQYTKRARIAQSSALPLVIDKPASSIRDDSQGEACPTDSGLEAEQDRANITKTSTLPSDLAPRVTSLAADEGSMQHKLTELTDLCTRLQRQQDEMDSKITTQDLEIYALKARIKHLEDRDGGDDVPSREDATIKGWRLETGEEASIERSTKKGSDDTEEMVNVLTSLDATSVLSSEVQVSVPPAAEVATVSIPPAGEIHPISVPTGSGVVPTASPIFTTATVATLYTRRKGKEKMVESDIPKKKKKLQEHIDVQVAREMEEQLAREDQRRDEQIARDAEIARIHAEEELQMMVDGLDRSNEMIAKHLHEYDQAAAELTIREKIELINELVKYQDHHKSILKYQAQQSKPLQEATERILYVSAQESCRFKRKGLSLEQDSAKKVKTSEEVSEEDLKEMMHLVPVEEVYVEDLQVKHLIIDWEIHTEGQSSYWKIIRLGGSTTSYQFLVDMLKHFDREDLNHLWALVKETLNIKQATSNKEKELWVELKRLYEPDVEDQLWTQTQALMHDPVEWRLYDSCGVHHILLRDQEIFKLVEREYPLRKGLTIIMISNKLQVENYSQMASDMIQKIHKIANSPRQRSD